MKNTYWQGLHLMQLFGTFAAVCLIATASFAAPRGITDSAGPRKVRKLVPGVETTVPLDRQEQETYAVHHIVELINGVPTLKWTPQETEISKTLFEKAQNVLFRRGIWQLKFVFKPLRLIRVDIPQSDGKMKTEVIWYIVYRVINPGQHITPQQNPKERFNDGTYKIVPQDSPEKMTAEIGPHLFTPTFLMRTHRTADLAVGKSTIQYGDKVIPAARRAIYDRELPNCSFDQFHDSAQMGRHAIPVSTKRKEISRWGVITWIDDKSDSWYRDQNLNPAGRLRKADYMTIQIMGLTNAYKWVDPEGALKPGDAAGTGRDFVYKTLQMNYYRPGDSINPREEEIQLGVKNHPKHFWLYRHNPLSLDPIHPRE